MNKLRVAVLGAGSFGSNHIRAIREFPDIESVGVFDVDRDKAGQFRLPVFRSINEITESSDCAIVATPTVTHEEVASKLLSAGLDVLVEKPIADSSAAGDRMSTVAKDHGRILQVGHLERFNPAVVALEQVLTLPLFFEVHRLSVFTPRSLDVDVVLDLMIHDLDIVLHFTREMPVEIRAAGISVLSPFVDIANVRLAFGSGCVANLTASRVSTEKVRKLRLFQPGEYVSVDYQRQEAVRLAIRKNKPSIFPPEIGFESLKPVRGEPLKLELESFFNAVRHRSHPEVDGIQATNALRVAEAILAKIKEHADLVAETVRRNR